MDDRKIIEFPGQKPVIRTSVKEELIIDQLKQVMPTVAMFTQGLYNYCILLDANTDPAELANNKKDRLSTKLHNAANYVNEAIRILDELVIGDQSMDGMDVAVRQDDAPTPEGEQGCNREPLIESLDGKA